jgi:hypothetical protein
LRWIAAMRKLRAHYQWLQIAFAVAWIGVLSLYWIRIKMGATFQSLLAAGLAQPFPLSVVYVTFIYVVAITAILWAGLCIYLAITGSLNLRRLLRGLWLIAIVVVPSLSSGIFRKGLPLSPLAAYLILWLPWLVAVDTSAAVRAEGIAVVTSRYHLLTFKANNGAMLRIVLWLRFLHRRSFA